LGANDRGQLGIGSFDPQRNTPVKLEHFPPNTNTRITRVAAGRRHTLAIDSRGNLWAWGANGNGQLGIGTTFDSPAPARVHFPNGTPRIMVIATGGDHSLAVDANGNLWAWGFDLRGQLGIGTLIDSHAPARVVYPVGATHPIVSIAAGNRHSLALESRSFLFGLEAVLDFEPVKAHALLLPQSLTPDAITVTATSSTIDPAGHKLLVTNTLTDTAGNKLVLTLIEQRDDPKSLVVLRQKIRRQ
jgi:alpha-tubulin suppressor-like RCC1 family protein